MSSPIPTKKEVFDVFSVIYDDNVPFKTSESHSGWDELIEANPHIFGENPDYERLYHVLECWVIDFANSIENKELRERMEAAAEEQSLSTLYEQNVDAALYEEGCDFEKDATGLFFDLDEDKFIFIDYVTKYSGWADACQQQNNVILVAYIDANKAVESSLNEIIDEYFDDFE